MLLERIVSVSSATRGAEDEDLLERYSLLYVCRATHFLTCFALLGLADILFALIPSSIDYFGSKIRAALSIEEAQTEDTVTWDIRHDLIRQKQELEALRYAPYFVSGPDGIVPRVRTTVIDGGPSLQDLGDLTTLKTKYYQGRAAVQGGQRPPDDEAVGADLLGRKLSLQLALTKLYVATLFNSTKEEEPGGEGSDPAQGSSSSSSTQPTGTPIMASWTSFVTSYGFYFIMLLGGSQPESLYGPGVVRHMTTILHRELARSESDMENGMINRDLWLWMVFPAAGVLARAQDRPQADREYCTDDFREARQWLESRIRLWSHVTGVTDWNGAKQALRRVLWPEGLPGADFMESVWTRALEGGPGTVIPSALVVSRRRPPTMPMMEHD